MEPMEIVKRLWQEFPDECLETVRFQGQVSVITKRENIVAMLSWLKDADKIRLNHLMCLCGVDNLKRLQPPLERFEVAYSLFSITHGHEFRLRAQVPEGDPCIDSATGVWVGADWPERECFDLLGISFTGHPDLRRILLPDDWQGYPLRKEYPLKGREEWAGYEELVNKVEELKQFDFHPDSGSSPKND